MESFAWNTCYVCHDSTEQTSENVSQLHSMHSQLKMPDLLKIILGEELSVDWTTSDTMCSGCIAKVNDYDEAIQKAQTIQSDLVMVYRERRVNVKMECDDPISIEANSPHGTDYDIDEVEEKFGIFQSSIFDDAQDEEYSMQSPSTPSHLGSGVMTRPIPSSNRKHKTLARHSRKEHGNSSNRFSCKFCLERFPKMGFMKIHMEIHERAKANGPPYYCEFCTLEFHAEHEFDDHRKLHRSAPKFQCFHCPHVSKTIKMLKQHMNSHTRHNKCCICGRGLIDVQSRQQHMKLHGNGTYSECYICKFQTLSTDTLAEHMREEHVMSTVPTELSCEICSERFIRSKKFSASRNLQRHMKFLHEDAKANGPPYHCEFCGLEFHAENDFDEHREYHRSAPKFQCLLCPQVLKDRKALKPHMQSHTEINRCGVCGQGCIDALSLEMHMKQHKTESFSECYICKFTTLSADTLAEHMQEEHVCCNGFLKSTFRSDLSCKICSEKFAKSGNLRRHMHKHNGAKASGPPYNCEFCGLEFYAENEFDEHIGLHRAALKFQCFHCPTVPKSMKMLKQHMKSHTRFYKCNVCGRGSIDAEALKRHMKLQGHEKNDEHQETDDVKRVTKPPALQKPRNLPCDVCHKKFTTHSLLEVHMKRHNSAKDNGPPYLCGVCRLEFYAENEFDQHLEHHRSVPIYQCLHCEFIGKDEKLYHSHMISHTRHYKCKLCNRGCIDSFALKRHLATHLDFECSICDFQTKSIEEFQGHLRDEHENLDPSLRATDCVLCQKQFESDQALQTHLTLVHTKHESPPTQCTQCGIRLKDTDALVDHKIRHLNRAQYQCVLCDRVVASLKSLHYHMRTHTQDTPHRCECGSKYTCEQSLRKHMTKTKHSSSTVLEQEVFDEATYIAQQSQNGSSSVAYSIDTQTKSNRPKCTNCWATFGSNEALKEHTKLAKCKERKFVCKVCDKAFAVRHTYFKHLKIHNLSAPETEPPFICDYCNIELPTYEDLGPHESLHVNRSGFGCLMCEYKTPIRNRLKSHMHRVHVKQDPVQCDTCGKVFNNKHILWTHRKYHEELFNECYICKLRMLSKRSLILHMRKHTGDKPYKCKHCDKRFARRANRRAHYLVHRGLTVRSYKCTICGVVFPRASQRSEHYRQTHGLLRDPPKRQLIEIKK